MSDPRPSRSRLPAVLARGAYWLACAGGLTPWLYAAVLAECDSVRRPTAWMRAAGLGCEPLAIALACAALYGLRRADGPRPGRPYALAALGVAALALAVTLPTAQDLDRNWLPRRSAMLRLSCLSNVKQLAMASMMYAQDSDGRLPSAANWNAATRPYAYSDLTYVCPNEVVGDLPSYAMNRQAAGMAPDAIAHPEQTVILYESIPGRNLAGGAELLPARPRHNSVDYAGFADGHARSVSRRRLGSANWSPSVAPPDHAKVRGKR